VAVGVRVTLKIDKLISPNATADRYLGGGFDESVLQRWLSPVEASETNSLWSLVIGEKGQ